MDELQWFTPKESRLKQLRMEWFYLKDGLQNAEVVRAWKWEKKLIEKYEIFW